MTPQDLRTLRKARDWTQEQLAEIAGLSARTISRLERGEPMSAETWMAVRSALGVVKDAERRVLYVGLPQSEDSATTRAIYAALRDEPSLLCIARVDGAGWLSDLLATLRAGDIRKAWGYREMLGMLSFTLLLAGLYGMFIAVGMPTIILGLWMRGEAIGSAFTILGFITALGLPLATVFTVLGILELRAVAKHGPIAVAFTDRTLIRISQTGDKLILERTSLAAMVRCTRYAFGRYNCYLLQPASSVGGQDTESGVLLRGVPAHGEIDRIFEKRPPQTTRYAIPVLQAT